MHFLKNPRLKRLEALSRGRRQVRITIHPLAAHIPDPSAQSVPKSCPPIRRNGSRAMQDEASEECSCRRQSLAPCFARAAGRCYKLPRSSPRTALEPTRRAALALVHSSQDRSGRKTARHFRLRMTNKEAPGSWRPHSAKVYGDLGKLIGGAKAIASDPAKPSHVEEAAEQGNQQSPIAKEQWPPYEEPPPRWRW